jgi:hypothetical protein
VRADHAAVPSDPIFGGRFDKTAAILANFQHPARGP